ncbi:hypothetical protein B0H19DRAFT_924499, partial [Mycena capillaripes]
FLQFDIQYSSLALLFYDFALTLPTEVRYIWGQRFRLSTVLYIGCRYALVANILYLLAIGHKLSSKVCDLWYKVVGGLSVLGRTAVILVFTMKTYAIYGKNRWILAYMGVLGLACVALDIVESNPVAILMLMNFCPTVAPKVHLDPQPLPAPKMLSILVVIFESSSAFLTVLRCVMAFRAGGPATRRRGLMFILFKQGKVTSICLTISIFTTAGVILNYPGLLQRIPNAFTVPLSCVLTARFILLLRKWDEAQLSESDNDKKSRVGSPMKFRTPPASQVSRPVLSNIVSVDDFGPDPVLQARRLSETVVEYVQQVHLGSQNHSDPQFVPIGEGEGETRGGGDDTECGISEYVV